MPFTTEDGEHWDLLSGPDLYYKVYGPDETRLHTSDVASDLRPSDLPVVLSGGFDVEPPNRYVVQLLDADLAMDDVVARIAFAPDQLTEGGRLEDPPSAVRLVDGDTTLRLALTWD